MKMKGSMMTAITPGAMRSASGSITRIFIPRISFTTKCARITCGAALCGAASTASCESGSSSPLAGIPGTMPKFSLERESRFDLLTYEGRACHFIDTLGDLSTLFVTKKQVDDAKALLNDFQERQGRGCMAWSDEENEALWRARKVVEATCHPETGDIIPSPVRFSAFAPANLLICAGMLRPNPTLLSSAFWQWVNQSYNACVNHCNRSSALEDASSETERTANQLGDASSFTTAYLAATSSALAICLGLQEGARRLSGGSARVASLVRLTVPMLAVSVSANVNLLMVRSRELTDGVPVADEDGVVLGSSVVAARQGLAECAATRVLWTFLLLTATPICATAAFATLPPRLAASQTVRIAVELGVSFGVIWLSVPLAIAAFPQRESLSVAELEQELRECWRTTRTGKGEVDETIARVTFNRGL